MRRRFITAVERLETRDTPSSLAFSAGVPPSAGALHGYGDPNEGAATRAPLLAPAASPGAISGFNPQPDPPARAAIIAI